MMTSVLSLITFLPLLGVIIILIMPQGLKPHIKKVAISFAAMQVVLAFFVYANFEKGLNASVGVNIEEQYQLIEHYDWINLDLGGLGHLSIDYFLAIDGISVTMLILATFVMFIGAVASWNIERNAKGYFALYLLLCTSIVGCFVALDFFLFYLFFEFMLLPMYFLIGLWGGRRRDYASIKFFLYTLVGSIFILIVMIGLYISVIDPVETAYKVGLVSSGEEVSSEILVTVKDLLQQGAIKNKDIVHTFNMVAMMDIKNYIPGSFLSLDSHAELLSTNIRLIAFLALFVGFAIKLPMFPFHTWMPDAHVEAPTAVSVVLAGILLKVGAYGIIRTAYSIFPEGAIHFAWWIGLAGVLSIIYGALNALAMKDMKKLVAYSSLSHMGFVLLGLSSLTSEGVSGALYQVFSHGLISPLLFLIVGVIYDRTHNREIESYRGLAAKMPQFTTIVVIAFFASLGLPGFSGFIAELLVFLGSFNSASVNSLLPRWMSILAVFGLVLTAAFYLWALQRMFFGKYWIRDKSWDTALKPLTTIEYVVLLPLVAGVILFGVLPHLFLDLTESTVGHFITYMNTVGKSNLIAIRP